MRAASPIRMAGCARVLKLCGCRAGRRMRASKNRLSLVRQRNGLPMRSARGRYRPARSQVADCKLYFNASETLWYLPCTTEPKFETTAIIAPAIQEASSAYSIEVAPLSSQTKSRTLHIDRDLFMDASCSVVDG